MSDPVCGSVDPDPPLAKRNLHALGPWLRVSAVVVLLACLVPVRDSTGQVGTCGPGLAVSYLDVNNVRARVLTLGGLFYGGGPAGGGPGIYTVPRFGDAQALWMASLWIGGYVSGEVRVAASFQHWSNWQYWPGPLDTRGTPPSDCGPFDRLYKVGRVDIEEYESTGMATPDLREWPTGLGAPTYAAPGNGLDDDGDGMVDEAGEPVDLLGLPLSDRKDRVIDLDGGERPAILGDQSIWWIMNDAGNLKRGPESAPIGLEVHAMAFAFAVGGDVGNTTFYQYRIFNKGPSALDQAYVGYSVDGDVGHYQDDWVGSDSLLGLAYYWNADNYDQLSPDGYGASPPAVGIDFVRGPLVGSEAETLRAGVAADSDYPAPGISSHLAYVGGGCVFCFPIDARHHYLYLTGLWGDGTCITHGGALPGYRSADRCTRFVFPGDVGEGPETCQFWSECNLDGQGSMEHPADRRSVAGSGPFTLAPGEVIDFTMAIVWARGENNYDSVRELKQADQVVQTLADAGFTYPRAPDAPELSATALDGQIILSWSNDARSNNYLEGYAQIDPFARSGQDLLRFEGYEVLQYETEQDAIGRVVAVYDVPNGIRRVLDVDYAGQIGVIASGTDRGTQTYHVVNSVTNYRDYHFGVRAYAYNAGSDPSVIRGPTARIKVQPARPSQQLSEQALAALADPREVDFEFVRTGIGNGRVTAKVVDPTALQDARYAIKFYALDSSGPAPPPVTPKHTAEPPVDALVGSRTNVPVVTYDIIRDGVTILDGSVTARPAPQRVNAVLLDGLQFSIVGPTPGFRDLWVTANASGALDPPESALIAGLGFPDSQDRLMAVSGRQQATAAARWALHAGGADSGTYGAETDRTSFLGRVTRQGVNSLGLGPHDFEMRFTARCRDGLNGTIEASDCLAARPFDQDGPDVIEVPFEIWDTGVATPKDVRDDVRMVPAVCDTARCGGGAADGVFDIGGDHGASAHTDDPFSDWIYWYLPEDRSPGESGYAAYWAHGGALEEVLARMVLVLEDGGEQPPWAQTYPEVGTVFRLETTKPIQPGDVYTASTVGYGARDPGPDVIRTRLDEIGIVPNPYRGTSAYETRSFLSEVRFTNLPDVATIRVFNLNGTLIRTLHKTQPGIPTLSWDLLTDHQLPVASGLYLVHVEVPEVGSTILKFAVVKGKTYLNVY